MTAQEETIPVKIDLSLSPKVKKPKRLGRLAMREVDRSNYPARHQLLIQILHQFCPISKVAEACRVELDRLGWRVIPPLR